VENAARGKLTDRNGTVLAQNRTVYDLYVVTPAPPGTDLEQTCNRVQAITGGEDVETQLAAFCSAVSAGELLVARDVSLAQRAALADAGLLQSGAVRLTARGVRSWPEGTLFPHLLGFPGPITAGQWPDLAGTGVAMDAEVGQAGLELVYETLLRGQDGALSVAALRSGERTETETAAPVPGATLVLTVDAGLQRALQTALAQQITALQTTRAAGAGREARAGAAVVVDVATGGILAAVSWPGFDLNRYRDDYAALSTDGNAPLMDRVTTGLYAPGSAFKPAVAAAALTAQIPPEETVFCGGSYPYYAGYQPRCLQYGHAGPVDMVRALEHSCNIYFYDVGRRLGVDAFSAMAQALGLAADTGAELPQAAGRLTWSSDSNFQNGLTLMAAIGQGNTAVTPLQLAAYATALANDGVRPTLHFAGQAVDAQGQTVWRWQPDSVTVPGGEAVFGVIREGMKRMAQSLRVLREAPVVCAAKTGSPQLAETLPDGGHYTNSVLIGYAPADKPQIAAAVVIELGGGGSNAAPVLRAVLDYCEKAGYFAGS
ncbi:MAG: penicillin-binding transpeptidase domain-containing protein, partial [Gemmiger sp.]